MTQKIGRYEVKSEIARGGMATVFHAYDPNFERDVAIKVLPHAFLHDPQFRTRFEREAKMIALLEHPAIVPVYDFGEEDGQPYIVMRYMAGGSLTERIEQGAISLTETAQIIMRLAPALDAAHARHIIHRDLKPGNILFDQYGNAYLSDFGIARLAEESGMTLTGTSIVGTPAYMSPEQVQGDKQIDGRSDIYALGVLIFQMLTGDMPYQSDTPAKVMMMHVLHPVPDILEFSSSLPPACQTLITKSMAKKPEERYPTAGEMAAVLENISLGKLSAPAPASKKTKGGREPAVSTSDMATAYSAGKTVVSASKGQAAAGAQAAPAPRSGLAALAIPLAVGALALIVIAALLGFLGTRGSGPLAFLAPATVTYTPLPTETSLPSSTPAPPSATPEPTKPIVQVLEPTSTPTEVPPTPTETFTPEPQTPVIGGVDKVAFLRDSDIWISNLDGTQIERLTEDGTIKSSLQWSPDGQAVNYISGKCIYSVRLEDTRVDIITCFNFVDYLKAFEISHDGTRVAISLDNQLYIVPYDLEKLNQVSVRSGLTDIAECKDFAPYLRNFVKYARWSKDDQFLGMVIFGVAADIGSADIVQIIPMETCTASPRAVDNFPPPRFKPAEYITAPSILNFGWDGLSLFAINTLVRRNGFGNLWVYNMDLHKARNANPIDESCCYRDAQFSPDGTYLFFAYQKYPGGDGSILFYYIPYGTIGTGAAYTPLPIPPITNPDEAPQPALRTAR
ncbi:MAG: protein kinase [Chloroflexota bacterium]